MEPPVRKRGRAAEAETAEDRPAKRPRPGPAPAPAPAPAAAPWPALGWPLGWLFGRGAAPAPRAVETQTDPEPPQVAAEVAARLEAEVAAVTERCRGAEEELRQLQEQVSQQRRDHVQEVVRLTVAREEFFQAENQLKLETLAREAAQAQGVALRQELEKLRGRLAERDASAQRLKAAAEQGERQRQLIAKLQDRVRQQQEELAKRSTVADRPPWSPCWRSASDFSSPRPGPPPAEPSATATLLSPRRRPADPSGALQASGDGAAERRWQQEVDDLRQRLAMAEEQADALADRLRRAEDGREAAAVALAGQADAVAEAAAAAAGLQRAVAEERQQREAADRRSAEAEAALAAAEAEGAALRGRLAAAQQAVDRLQQAQEAERHTEEGPAHEAQHLRQRCTSLEAELERAERDMGRLQAEAAWLANEAAAHQKEVQKLQSEVQTLQDARAALQQEVGERLQQCAAAEAAAAASQDALQRVEREAQEAVVAAAAQAEALQQQITQRDAEVLALQESLRDQHRMAERLRELEAAQRLAEQSLQARTDDMQRVQVEQMQRLEEELQALQQRAGAAEAQAAAAAGRLQVAEAERRRAEERVAELTATYDRLRDLHEAAQRQADEGQRRLEEALQALQERVETSEAQAAAAAGRLQVAEAERQRAEERLAELTATYDRLRDLHEAAQRQADEGQRRPEEELQALQQRAETAEAQASAAAARLQAAEAERRRAEERVAELTALTDRLRGLREAADEGQRAAASKRRRGAEGGAAGMEPPRDVPQPCAEAQTGERSSTGIQADRRREAAQAAQGGPDLPRLAALLHRGRGPLATEGPAVVVDSGSGLCKVGFAGQETPACILPSLVGRPRTSNVGVMGHSLADTYVGAAAQSRRGVLTLQYPVERGIVQDWDAMEAVWECAFRDIGLSPKGQSFLLTEPAQNPLSNRERLLEVFFERFDAAAVYVATQGALALCGRGCTTGVAVDCGHGLTQVSPVYEGHCLPHACQRMQLGGADLTQHLAKLLTQQGQYLKSSAEMELVREMKEKVCHVALDYHNEVLRSSDQVEYELPDGRCLALSSERLRCPEVLFQPALCGLDQPGLPDVFQSAVAAVDRDLQPRLWQTVVLAGGTTTCQGFPERLDAELRRRAPAGAAPHVTALDGRATLAWRGGAILAALPTAHDLWIPRDLYRERGTSVVHAKCF